MQQFLFLEISLIEKMELGKNGLFVIAVVPNNEISLPNNIFKNI